MLFKEGVIIKGYEVLDYAMELHYKPWETLEMEESTIPERIDDDTDYILKKINIDIIEKPIFSVDEDVIKNYMEMDLKTSPPIVLEHYENKLHIVDGTHRYFAFKNLKEKEILAYVPLK